MLDCRSWPPIWFDDGSPDPTSGGVASALAAKSATSTIPILPVFERVSLFADRSADHIRASGQTAALKSLACGPKHLSILVVVQGQREPVPRPPGAFGSVGAQQACRRGR